MTRQDLTENFALNMEKERVTLGYSQDKMAKSLGISLSAYKRILTGESAKIDIYIIYQMYRLTNKLGYELGQITDPYLEVFDHLRRLSLRQLNFISAIIDFELKFKEGIGRKDLPEDYITVLIPTGEMQDGMIYDSFFFEKFNVAPYRRYYGDTIDCGIRVTSGNFHPVYHVDDILLIDRQPLRDGDTGLFFNTSAGLVYIRKFYRASVFRLKPVNNYGTTIYIDPQDDDDMEHWIFFGRIVSKIRT